jgi:hypothetical protein
MATDDRAQQEADRLLELITTAHRIKNAGGDATGYLALHCTPRELDLLTALWGSGVATGKIRLAGEGAPTERPGG